MEIVAESNRDVAQRFKQVTGITECSQTRKIYLKVKIISFKVTICN